MWLMTRKFVIAQNNMPLQLDKYTLHVPGLEPLTTEIRTLQIANEDVTLSGN